jgi:hypothetical protein
MDLLGIDGRGNEIRSWANVRKFFDAKMPELSKLQKKFAQIVTGKGQLISAVLVEVIDSLKRQLSEMDYFQINSDDLCCMDIAKLQLAPLSNLGCESEFVKLNNKVKTAGGMPAIKT